MTIQDQFQIVFGTELDYWGNCRRLGGYVTLARIAGLPSQLSNKDRVVNESPPTMTTELIRIVPVLLPRRQNHCSSFASSSSFHDRWV